MNQRVGICVPSGCSLNEIERNYREVYEGVGSQLVSNIFLQRNKIWSCVTDDFVEEYMSIHNSDEYKSRAGMFTYL